jgi:hypothetical protein
VTSAASIGLKVDAAIIGGFVGAVNVAMLGHGLGSRCWWPSGVLDVIPPTWSSMMIRHTQSKEAKYSG